MERRKKLLERIKSQCVILNLEIVNENEINTTLDRFQVKCTKCKHIFIVNCKDILKRNRVCSLCKEKNKRYTLEYILKKIQVFCENNQYVLLSTINKPILNQKISIQHISGGIKEIFISQIIYKPEQITSLPYTFINKKDIIEKEIKEKCYQNNLTPLFIEDFKNEKTKIVLQCNECQRIWTTSYRSFAKSKLPCRCRKHNYKETKELRTRKIQEICQLNNYTFLGWVDENKYGVHSYIKICCNKHQHIWTPIYKDFTSGKGCMICSNECNVYEQRFLRLFKKHFPLIDIIYQYRNKKILHKQSLDFYLPQYNIAIEIQGEQHFTFVNFGGNSQSLDKIQKRDLKKMEICKENNIHLLYFSFSSRQYLPQKYFSKIYVDINELFDEIQKIIDK